MSYIAGLFPGSAEEVLQRVKAMLPNDLARQLSLNQERAQKRKSWDVPGGPLKRWCAARPIEDADELRFSVPKSKAERLARILDLDPRRHVDLKKPEDNYAVIHFRRNDLENKIGPALMQAYLIRSLKATLEHNQII